MERQVLQSQRGDIKKRKCCQEQKKKAVGSHDQLYPEGSCHIERENISFSKWMQVNGQHRKIVILAVSL